MKRYAMPFIAVLNHARKLAFFGFLRCLLRLRLAMRDIGTILFSPLCLAIATLSCQRPLPNKILKSSSTYSQYIPTTHNKIILRITFAKPT